MAISLDTFRAYVDANQGLSDNQLVNIADRAEGKLGNRKCVALGFRDDTFKTQNLAARDAFLKAVLTRCHANSIKELPPAVLKSLNIDKFNLDKNGRVTSNKPLTMRRIKAVLTAIDNENREVRTEKAIQALKPSITKEFSKSLGAVISDRSNQENFFKQLKSCFLKHLSANTLNTIIKNIRDDDGADLFATLANEIFQGTKDGLKGLTRNDLNRISSAFNKLGDEIKNSADVSSLRKKILYTPNDCVNQLMIPFLNFIYFQAEHSSNTLAQQHA